MHTTLTRFALIIIGCALSATVAFAQKAPEAGSPSTAFSVWIAKHLAPSVVVVKVGSNGAITKQGTGIVVRADGVILTAYHVIKDAKQVQIVS